MCDHMRTVEMRDSFEEHCFRTGKDIGRCQYMYSEVLEPEYCKHSEEVA